MRSRQRFRRPSFASTLGGRLRSRRRLRGRVVLGRGAAWRTVEHASHSAVLDATHLPPLLTAPGRADRARATTSTARRPSDEIADAGCDARGTVFVRASGARSFASPPARNRAAKRRPPARGRRPGRARRGTGGFEYYAVLEAPAVGERSRFPPAEPRRRSLAAARAQRRRRARGTTGSASDATRRRPRRIRALGRRPRQRPGSSRGGTSRRSARRAFDVDTSGNGLPPRPGPSPRAPLATRASTRPAASRLGQRDARRHVRRERRIDLRARDDAPPGAAPLVRRVRRRRARARGRRDRGADAVADPDRARRSGRPAAARRTSGRRSSWTVCRRRRARAARAWTARPPLRGRARGRRTPRTATRFALRGLAGRTSTRSWRVTSATPLAEVQLAEPWGPRVVVVVRVYDDTTDEFVVLVLVGDGLVERFALDSADWAETAPLARFRLVGSFALPARLDARGVFVDRFDLEVR